MASGNTNKLGGTHDMIILFSKHSIMGVTTSDKYYRLNFTKQLWLKE